MANEITVNGRRKALIDFAKFLVSVFLIFAGYSALLCLQTSINIEGGVGAASTTAGYCTSAIFGVVVTPVLLRKFESKYVYLASSITYLVYIAANYYPVDYILIPAGVIVGIGEATVWPVMLMYVVHYAKRFSKSKSKDPVVVASEFTGYFFCCFQFCQTFGNLLSYVILYAGKTVTDNEGNDINYTATVDLLVCGANDCQYPNVTNSNLNQYVPQSDTILYIMIGVMGLLVLVGILLVAVFIEKIKGVTNPLVSLKRGTSFSRFVTDFQGNVLEPASNESESAIEFTKKTVLATVKHMINPKQLLITPFALYSGLYMTFMFSELPRAYASCMLGVAQVGLCLAISFTCDALSSYLCCKLVSVIGRTIPFLVILLLDIGTYTFLLCWIPTPSTTWLVYVIFVVIGCIDGVWQPQISIIHGQHFPENQDIAFVVWNFWSSVGIAIQFGWSTSLCVYVKIYIQIGLLCFSMLCYGIAEHRFQRESKIKNKRKDVEIKL